MLSLEFILSYILIVIIIVMFSYFVYKNQQIKEKGIQGNLINNYENIMSILEYNMDKAYNNIYKSRLLVYSLEATTPNDQEYSTTIKDFISLTRKFLGPTLLNSMINFFGEETLHFIMASYFVNRYDDDELKKASQQNMMGGNE